MAITHHECYNSPRVKLGQNSTAEIEFVFKGTEDISAIVRYALTVIPTYVFGLPREEIDFEPDGWQRWRMQGKYGTNSGQQTEQQQSDPIDSPSTFDTSGGTQHIKHSLETVGAWRSSSNIGSTPSFHNAINCDNQNVNGTDIVVPVYAFTETRTFPYAAVNQAYKANLYNATGKTNNAPFFGFERGEVLTMGFSGATRGNDEYEITGRFAASPNLSALSVGDITGINKGGWEFLWLYFEDDVEADTLIKKPLYAYAERVYEETPLSSLGF